VLRSGSAPDVLLMALLYRGLSQQTHAALRRWECAGRDALVGDETQNAGISAGLEIATRGSCFSPGSARSRPMMG